MVNIISKVSKGTRMDQIYIPKKRAGLSIGTYVLIKPLEKEEKTFKPFFYKIKYLEPIKTEIIDEIFREIDADNVIITGSFLDRGFNFNDVDIVIITENKMDVDYITRKLKDKIGINPHIIQMSNKAFLKGVSTDPLYRLMLSKCVSRKRLIFKAETRIKYKLLDLHFLKSKLLVDNFDELSGDEKYNLVRNAMAITSFIDKKEVDDIHLKIDRYFGKGTVDRLKKNIVDKKPFLDKYKKIITRTQNKIFQGIKDESKQK